MDLAVFAAHPDDAELFAGGLIARCLDMKREVGICNLTRGERGTRGTPEKRRTEAEAAARALGLPDECLRTLDLGDTQLENSEPNRIRIVRVLREWRPRIVVTHHPFDRHPDHRKACELVNDAFFYAHLRAIETGQPPHRPEARLRFFNNSIPDERPSFILDISDVFERKLAAIRAYESQFHNPAYAASHEENQTFISSPEFFEQIQVRARFWGGMIGVRHGEAYIAPDPIGVRDPIGLLIP